MEDFLTYCCNLHIKAHIESGFHVAKLAILPAGKSVFFCGLLTSFFGCAVWQINISMEQ